jgi:hypothetical protein
MLRARGLGSLAGQQIKRHFLAGDSTTSSVEASEEHEKRQS